MSVNTLGESTTMLRNHVFTACTACMLLCGTLPLGAQEHAMATSGSPGQAAFGAIRDVVRTLESDPKTDWSKVNLEALRQHLIDMDDVTMRSEVVQRQIAGGLQMDVTGAGRTTLAIRRMITSHGAMLDQSTAYRASTVEIPNGTRLTVTSRNPDDAKAVARIRGLGFAGILTEGDHHAQHHIALARGDAMAHAR